VSRETGKETIILKGNTKTHVSLNDLGTRHVSSCSMRILCYISLHGHRAGSLILQLVSIVYFGYLSLASMIETPTNLDSSWAVSGPCSFICVKIHVAMYIHSHVHYLCSKFSHDACTMHTLTNLAVS